MAEEQRASGSPPDVRVPYELAERGEADGPTVELEVAKVDTEEAAIRPSIS